MTVIGPVEIRKRSAVKTSGHSSEPEEVKVQIPQKAQLDPLGVLCVKFEDNRTSTFFRKRIVYGRPNGPTPCNLAY